MSPINVTFIISGLPPFAGRDAKLFHERRPPSMDLRR